MATKPQADKATKSQAGTATNSTGKKLKITLVRSVINTRESHRATVRGLGLRRLNHTVEIEDTPATRGMVNKVGYLLKCEE